ncbi:histone deacetylase family protein [Persicirhabdus sediminis]|uniref:Histone deacetylase n=1 Tax=Persicirhabdus sediminis TaxID=454144 RepID=A0A8J7MCZ2_9BACT|nr:histone deacetylase [Persicirhabdus sediminis]MBK1790291.1 histone deacetylase [Persicirhabdus sediminis]
MQVVDTSNLSTGVHADTLYLDHYTGAGHPESEERYRAILAALADLQGETSEIPLRRATVAEVLLCHDAYYHDFVRMDVDNLADVLRTGDTAICPDSYDVAMHAVGSTLEAVDRVQSGELKNAFCAVRPPGHHASSGRGMGFCIFNNVAIAAQYLLDHYGLERVAILDWDVHHGNGTQDIFYESKKVFFASSHEKGIFPHTGYENESGDGDGVGYTLNQQLPAGSDGRAMIDFWQREIGSKLEWFKPQFILLSAGFDARVGDPIGDLKLTDDDFAELTKVVRGWARRYCDGKLVSVLEGGYDPAGTASAVRAHVRALSDVIRR